MTDLVPPGGERPVDHEPWPPAGTAGSDPGGLAGTTPIVLPGVPSPVPEQVPVPDDWRTMGRPGDTAPPGYQAAGRPAAHPTARTDRWGVAACVVAAAGLAQIAFVYVPVLSMLAVAFGATGRRALALDPPSRPARSRWLVSASVAGIVVGLVGVAIGVVLVVVTGELGNITP